MAKKIFQPGSVDYDGAVAANYAAARSCSDETASLWAAMVEPFIAQRVAATVLDLGCGTGRFSSLFAERFQAREATPEPVIEIIELLILKTPARERL